MINEVRLIGNLGTDPEMRESNYGSIANLSIATSEGYKDKKTGEWINKTEWHRVVAFGFTADSAEKLSKGDQVYVAGSLQTRKWTDNDGNDRYTTEVKARTIRKLGRANRNRTTETRGSDNFNDHSFNNSTGEDVPF